MLVTAHTPKALRVLRHKVVEALQPLCISVLHNDKQSQEELQSAVQKIHVRLSQDGGLSSEKHGTYTPNAAHPRSPAHSAAAPA